MKTFHFGYARWYYLTHPWEWVEDLLHNLRWAWQRVYRGWDDRVVWSIDGHLATMMPIWLQRLKETNHGVPCLFTNDNDYAEGERLWNEKLDAMISGFEAARKIVYTEFDSAIEEERLENEFARGMDVFTKYFFYLWD